MRTLTALGLALAIAGCSHTEPSGLDVPLPGAYRGPVLDLKGFGGSGVLTVEMTSTGPTTLGTWALDLSNGAYHDQGTLSGQTAGGHVTLILNPAVMTDCRFEVQAVTAADDHITGTWSEINCSVSYGGSVDLQRQ